MLNEATLQYWDNELWLYEQPLEELRTLALGAMKLGSTTVNVQELISTPEAIGPNLEFSDVHLWVTRFLTVLEQLNRSQQKSLNELDLTQADHVTIENFHTILRVLMYKEAFVEVNYQETT